MSYKSVLGPALFHDADGCHQAAIVVKVIDADTANLAVFDENAVLGQKLGAKLDAATGHYKDAEPVTPAEPTPETPEAPKEASEEDPHRRSHHRKH